MGKAEKSKESWQERRKKIKKKWHVPFIYVEWNCERLSRLLERWAFLDILEHVGRLGILVAVIFYIVGCPERKMQSQNLRMQVENLRQQLANQQKAKHYQAWQIINAAQGQRSISGRKYALQDLNKDGVSLFGVNLSGAYIPELELEDADLEGANLVEAILPDANLAGASLWNADLTKASLGRANLTGANLSDANLAGASLYGTDLFSVELDGANLVGANLRDADLTGASLRGADLSEGNLFNADFAEADLTYADLSGANLMGANFDGASLRETNLSDIKDWKGIESVNNANIYEIMESPKGFVEWAIDNGAVSIDIEFER